MPKPTKDELEQLYIHQRISPEQIGKMYEVSGHTIRLLMKEYGIQALGPSHLRTGIPNGQKGFKKKRRVNFTKEQLENHYLVEKLPPAKIAEMYGVSETNIRKWLKEFDIQTVGYAYFYEIPRPEKEVLKRLYNEEKLSPEQIGEIYGATGRTVRTWMRDYGISRLGILFLRPEQIVSNLKKRQFVKGATPHNKGRGDVSFVCEICGKTFTSKNHKRKKTCSESCFEIMLHTKGEDHWNYKGEQATTQQRRRNWAEYREWRKEILKKDNYTCHKCNKRGGKLTVHHIFNWSKYPEKRFDIDNGVTLCWSCHWSFHRKYGHHHTTSEMFMEWLSV